MKVEGLTIFFNSDFFILKDTLLLVGTPESKEGLYLPLLKKPFTANSSALVIIPSGNRQGLIIKMQFSFPFLNGESNDTFTSRKITKRLPRISPDNLEVLYLGRVFLDARP